MKKTFVLSAFILMCIVQWYTPVRLIGNKEKILRSGREFRFRTAPFDPYDAFRGKYINLSFDESSIQFRDSVFWHQGEMVYAQLKTDSSGFAHILTATKEQPADNVDYLKMMVGYVITDSVSSVTLHYPFDRFYMEESKAAYADEAYRAAARDTSQVAYALVKIHKGEGVIQDVFIDGVPIKEVAKKRQAEEEVNSRQ